MQSWKGNTNSYVETDVYPTDIEVRYFIITNKSATVVTLNVYIKDEYSVDYSISPKDLQLAAGESFRGFGLVVLNLEKVCLSVSGGTVDYCFSIFE